jgi:SCY1-like protein 2
VEESRKGIAFVTERVVCSLADILSRFEQVPGRYNWHSTYVEPNATITEVEISRGILNIAAGLQYLHTVKKKLHLNVSPESIVLTPTGHWKLCGFGFALGIQADEFRIALPYFLGPSAAGKGIRLEPDLRYSGSEMSDGGTGGDGATIRQASQSADVFSLGIVGYEMYRYNLMLAVQGRAHQAVIQVHNNSLQDHPLALQTVESLDYNPVPLAARQLLTGMLQHSAQSRLSLLDLTNNPFFHSGDMSVMNTIDELASKDVGSQASILSSLPSQICNFSPRIIENTVLPVICQVGVANPSMWVYTLPVLTFISSKITTAAFLRIATPAFVKGLAVSEFTETIHAFVKHIDLLLEKFDPQFFQANVVPMLCNGIDRQVSNTLQVATIASLVDPRYRNKSYVAGCTDS